MNTIDHILKLILLKLEEKINDYNFTKIEIPESTEFVRNYNLSTVTLGTARYQNDFFQSLTIANMSNQYGEILSVTVIAIPKPEYKIPVLGIDYVGFKQILNVAAFDYFPVNNIFWQKYCYDFLNQIHKENDDKLAIRKVPEFAKEVFSEQAFITSSKDHESILLSGKVVISAIDFYFAMMNLPVSELITKQGQQEKVNKWCQAMRKNRKEQKALANIFGEEFSSDYLDNFLFHTDLISEPELIAT